MRVTVDDAPRGFLDKPLVVPLTLLALILGGGALRLIVASQELFADELATYWVVSTHGLTDVVRTVASTAEITPPLSFVLSWFTTRIGPSPELLRLPALIAGIASIPLVYAVGKRTIGRDAALLATVLTTLSPFMIFYSAEGRGYGVLMAFVLLSTFTLLRAIDDRRAIWWVAHAVFVSLAAYTHYTSIFLLAVQFGWAFTVHPRARRPLLAATAGAALLFLPWVPSLRGDLSSPTTETLSFLSPLSFEFVRLSLGHWSIGYPLSRPTRSLSDLPGVGGLLLLALMSAVTVAGIVTARGRLRQWLGGQEGRVALVLLLAVASPVGAIVQSAIGTNVISSRNFASSWPYLALAVAALINLASPALRVTASALAVAGLALGAATMMTDDFGRPDYHGATEFADQHPGAVIVDGAAFTPGPLTNFDVEGYVPDSEVIRLLVPEQDTTPFRIAEPRPDPIEVAQRAVAAADGGPIVLISYQPPWPVVDRFIDALPEGYELTEQAEFPGYYVMHARVYERLP
jgi:4-amino-4-deoxy-L-arabinose transferase-like glycosyltransferase